MKGSNPLIERRILHVTDDILHLRFYGCCHDSSVGKWMYLTACSLWGSAAVRNISRDIFLADHTPTHTHTWRENGCHQVITSPLKGYKKCGAIQPQYSLFYSQVSLPWQHGHECKNANYEGLTIVSVYQYSNYYAPPEPQWNSFPSAISGIW